MAKIFILDDDQDICDMYRYHLNLLKHQTDFAVSITEGMEKLKKFMPDVVLLDVRLPDGNGLHILPRIKELPSKPDVIIVTGKGDPDGAELALTNGAWDYMEKPSSVSQMTLPIVRALEFRSERQSASATVVLDREGIIGESVEMKSCIEAATNAACSNASVLITGETGTGKELLANAIHKTSKRSLNKMTIVDCAAIPENLVESMLFGHEKGAFTGAVSAKEGLVKQANGGTLFLDEIGELPLTTQKSFLRVLQEHRFRPVGSNKEVKSDFRVIAATNRDLSVMVEEKLFREDLLFRLRAVSIEIPPLRKRAEDVSQIAMVHISKICKRDQMPMKGMTPEFISILENYDWPGNVRELVNALETALNQAQSSNMLYANHLPLNIRLSITKSRIGSNGALKSPRDNREAGLVKLGTFSNVRREAIKNIEKQYLLDLLSVSNQDINSALVIADVSRARLYELLKKHGLSFKKT